MSELYDWTDERCDQLRQMWLDRFSCSEIACELHTTRNSVIGKVHRLKLELRRNPTIPKHNRPLRTSHFWTGEQTKPKPVLKTKPKYRFNFSSGPSLVPFNIAALLPPVKQRSKEVHKNAGVFSCQWPVGEHALEADYFCGGEVARGSYCKEHAKLGYR